MAQVDVTEQLGLWTAESLVPGSQFYLREYGWCVAGECEIPEPDPMVGANQPCVIHLAEPRGDQGEIDALRFPPNTQLLVVAPVAFPGDLPPEEPPPAEPTFHTVWRDAETGEYVTEEYAAEHPDTTVSEQVPD